MRERRLTRAWVIGAVALVSSGAGAAAAIAASRGGAAISAPAPSPSVVRAVDMAADPGGVVSLSTGVTQAVKRVEPDVVGVENYQLVSNFFSQTSKLQATGIGTGVMFYKDDRHAYIVTNNHVVEGAAKVDIVVDPGKHHDADVVGTDPYTDLAVLRVPASVFRGVEPITFADSSRIEAGEPAIAIGTPLGLDFADTVTSGIVSAKSRLMPVQDEATGQTLDYQTVIQTDAAINPGNSGGPLLNIRGEVIGINSCKIVAQNFEGMGFAIPSNEVKVVAKQLMEKGHAVHPALGVEGYSLASLPQQMWPDIPVDYGVWVKRVTSLEARAAGLRPGDVIVGFNGQTVRTMAELRTALFQTKPGDVAALRVYRGDQLLALKVKIGQMGTRRTAEPALDFAR
ncbi:trypsin-like peptidase domain-containing protein [Alicyclobacillus fructus]|uniref:S1C family serine protease n=1 Tax=Alicyclobacillus fructus TaxID=2816082 RepID=UPI001F3A2BB9